METNQEKIEMDQEQIEMDQKQIDVDQEKTEMTQEETETPVEELNAKEVKWQIKASKVASRTTNPLRLIVDQLDINQINKQKKMIALSIGDPTVFGNLPVNPAIITAVKKVLESGKWNGYAHSWGYPNARKAVAKRFSYEESYTKLTENDVILTSGCSGALEIAIGAIADEGDNILIPQPGFSLYGTICESKGIETRHYRLLPEKDWEIDLEHLVTLIDTKTKAIIINNPSNPCGSNYSLQHLQEICRVAERYCIPIIADEVYADMVFGDEKFTPMCKASDKVPIISVGGLAKQFVVPGWRLGWILVYDRNSLLKEVKEGMGRLTTLILGPNTLIQAALEEIFETTPKEYITNLNKILAEHAEFSVQRLSQIEGLKVVRPRGAMYLMVGIEVEKFEDIKNDVEFAQKLLKEESVFVLPGQCFKLENFFRIVTCPPPQQLGEAYDRIAAFCKRHLKKKE